MTLVAKNVYRILDEKCLVQSKVGEKAGYQPNLFNAMLRNRKRITDSDIIRIAKVLDVTPNDLFAGWEDAPVKS